MKMLAKLTLIFLLLLTGILTGARSPALAAPQDGTTHGGVLSASETWTLAASPHYLDCMLTVPSGLTLTLEPGVTVLGRPGAWGAGCGLIVEGTLLAQGTSAQHITFDASDTAYGWYGVHVRGAAAQATIAFADILHGGRASSNNNYANLWVENGASLNLTDSRVANSIFAAGSNWQSGVVAINSSRAVLKNNVIADNTLLGLYALMVAGETSKLDMTNTSFSNNTYNAVLLGSDGLAATTNTLRPQPGLLGYDIGVPYSSSQYLLKPTGSLSLEPGVVMRGVNGPWGKGISLEVQGRLNAIGTAEQPVIFKAVSAPPAAWGGIYVNGGAANLVHTQILNAGLSQDYPAGPNPSLSAANGGNVTLAYSTIADNHNSSKADIGVWIDNAIADLENSTFSGLGNPGEADYPLKISGPAARVILRANTFTGNALDRILLANHAMTGADFTLGEPGGLSTYELLSTQVIPAGITLKVKPGTTIMGRSSTGIVVRGRLEAQSQVNGDIVFTSASNKAAGEWGGLVFDGAAATGRLDGAVIRYGGGGIQGVGTGFPTSGLAFQNLAADAVQVRRCAISQSNMAGWRIVNSPVGQIGTLDGNRIFSNTTNGLQVDGTAAVKLVNSAITDNLTGIYLGQNVQITLLHPTLARNSLGLLAESGSSANFTNSIIAANTASGVSTFSGASVTLNTTLWDGNLANFNGAGTVVNNQPLSGAPAFDPTDGYHLSEYSQALGKGQNTGVTTDIDGTSRPLPAGAAPDLGADEINEAAITQMTAQKIALPPVWVNLPDLNGNPLGELLQKYFIRFLFGSTDASAAPVAVKVEDNLPAALSFQSETHSPAMSFTASGQKLTWQTSQDVAPKSSVDVQVETRDPAPNPGGQYLNQAVVTAGSKTFNLSASTSAPMFTPLVIWPASGEICGLADQSLSVEGSAQPGTTIEVYEAGALKGSATTDASGLFKVAYTGSGAGKTSPLNLTARACKNGTCSAVSDIRLTPPNSFWDPQRSWWEGTPPTGPMAGKKLSFKFRNRAGYPTTQDWTIEGVYGFWDTDLYLYVCPNADGKMPTQLYVTADSYAYTPVDHTGNLYHFKISRVHTVKFQATYRPTPPPDPPDPDDPPPPPPTPPDPKPDYGGVLIDPDGYVFNSTLGFDQANPTAHVVPGAKVTCMANIPGWGGWVPWPAHLYQQVNPQIVGSNGYFAFFTPPGEYYLLVEGPSGYQTWRSPVVTVVNDIVHVNVPLMPVLSGNIYNLKTSLAGVSAATLTVPVGSVVRWQAVQGPQEDPAGLAAAAANPLLRLLSNPDPFASSLGWDSGRLVPGESYTRKFDTIGTYAYSDSAGHTGRIQVTAANSHHLYAPLVRR
jgi:hypothetical protein